MTIGSTHNHPADLAIDPLLPTQPWAACFPNPPDLDYRRLIEQEAGCRTCHTLHSLHLHRRRLSYWVASAQFNGGFTLEYYPHYQVGK